MDSDATTECDLQRRDELEMKFQGHGWVAFHLQLGMFDKFGRRLLHSSNVNRMAALQAV
jgi:hypothetical protein